MLVLFQSFHILPKGQRGMSKLLRKACEEAKEGNKNIASKVRHIGNKFLNAVEISALEAVYFVLQMPLRRSSREFQFINTSDPDERTFLLKSMIKLKNFLIIRLILSQTTLSKDISDDQSKWKTYASQILLIGITAKVRVMNRDTLKQVHLVQMITFQRVLLMII